MEYKTLYSLWKTNSQFLKAKHPQMPTDGWMDKQNGTVLMVLTHDIIIFNPKTEWNSDTCYYMNLKYIFVNRPDKCCMIPLKWGT